MHTANQLF